MPFDQRSLYQSRNIDLIHLDTEWGVAVSERTAVKSPAEKAMWVTGYLIAIAAGIAFLPALAGLLLASVSSGAWMELALAGVLLVLAIALRAQSKKGPRNALQIDYAADEVRLGSENIHGAFVRHKVCPFAYIEDVRVDTSSPAAAKLSLIMNGETATISLANADEHSLQGIVTKILQAKESARDTPVRSRVRSAVMGFDAGIREVSHRVRSRVSRTV